MTTITRFTKEQLIAKLQHRLTVAAKYPDVEEAELDAAIFQIALASLEADPVLYAAEETLAYAKHGELHLTCLSEPMGDAVIPLYTAPPAPVSVPVALNRLRSIVADPRALPRRKEWISGQQYSYVLLENVEAMVDDACRAAMLHGVEQQQNPQQNIQEIIPGGLVEAVNSLLNNDGSRGRYSAIGCGEAREKIELWLAQRQKWESQRSENLCAGNSPVIPDGCVLVPERLTAENGAKSALAGEFSETKFINCPECFGDDECETCDGSGRIEITVPVSWTTIKAIWDKCVEHFSAAPQQEAE